MRIRERFNPRAPCGARRHRSAKPLVSSRISTHAPLAGRDGRAKNGNSKQARISTHAPLAGRDMGIGYELEPEY